MSYHYGQKNQTTHLMSVEQARRRNAELRRELAQLTAENTELEAKTTTMRLQLTTERKRLTRQVRELDAARAQVDLISAIAPDQSDLPESKYGGRAGLQAAADEMKAHEDKQLKLSKPRKPRNISHGTRRKYAEGCRCDDCKAWRKQAAATAQTHRKRREAERKAA